MIVYVDMDGVLADFNAQFMKRVRRSGLVNEEATTYRLEDRISGIPQNMKKSYINSLLSEPGFWAGIPPIQGAVAGMNELLKQKKIKIYIATSPWYSSESCMAEKVKWVRKHLPKFPFGNIILISPKYLLRGDVLVDDKPEHVAAWQGPHAICYGQPWNTEVEVRSEPLPAVWRAGNWKSVVTLVEYISTLGDGIKNGN